MTLLDEFTTELPIHPLKFVPFPGWCAKQLRYMKICRMVYVYIYISIIYIYIGIIYMIIIYIYSYIYIYMFTYYMKYIIRYVHLIIWVTYFTGHCPIPLSVYPYYLALALPNCIAWWTHIISYMGCSRRMWSREFQIVIAVSSNNMMNDRFRIST